MTRSKLALALAFPAVCGLLGAFAITWRMNEQPLRSVPALEWAPYFVFGIIFSALVHEAGGIAAALLSSFRVLWIQAGPVIAANQNEGIRFRWTGSFAVTAVIVPNHHLRLRSRMVFVALAGPAGSLASGSVFLLLSVALPAFLAPLLVMLSCCAFGLALASALPSGGTEASARAADLLSGSERGERDLALMAMGLSMATSLRPADWSPDWVMTATAGGSAIGAYHGYLHDLDRYLTDPAALESAATNLEVALRRAEQFPWDPMARNYAIEGVYFEARHRRDLLRSQHWMAVAGKAKQGPPLERFVEMRASAALKFVETSNFDPVERQAALAMVGLFGQPTGWESFNEHLWEDLERSAHPGQDRQISDLASALRAIDEISRTRRLALPAPAKQPHRPTAFEV